MESVNWLKNYRLFQQMNKKNNAKLAESILHFALKLGFEDFILFNDSSMFMGFYLKELLQP